MSEEELTRSHQVKNGQHECLAIGKNDVKIWTPREGFAACGHCLAYLTDDQVEKIPFSLKDDMIKRGWIKTEEG
jgi:hypothetical protein